MAVGDRKTLVTQEFVDSIYDKKTNSTDDLNTYDSGKRATAKSVALLNDRIDEVEATIAGLSGGGGESYTLPVATDTILGGIKVGSGLTITNGVLSATGGDTVISIIPQTKSNYTAIYGQTTFNATYTVGHIEVFLNGIKLDDSEFDATNGTSITLNSGCLAGDIINIIGYVDITNSTTFYTKTDIDLKYGNIAALLDLINGEVI